MPHRAASDLNANYKPTSKKEVQCMHKYFHKALIAVVLVFSMVLPVLTPVVYAAGEGSAAGLKDYHSMTMEEIFAQKEDLTWVITGDSITHNGSWTQGMNSYSEWFEQYLYMTGRGDDSVFNTGWGGADIQDFLYEKDTPKGNGVFADPGMGLEQFITKYNPDVVTIKLGMNNRSMSDADFIKYYNKMLDGIYAEGKKNGKIPKVVIITPTPMSGETLTNQEQTDKDSCWRFQRILENIAQERELLFVDLQTTFCTMATQMGGDYRATFYIDPSDGGIHPNAAGHYLIFQAFSKVLGIYDEKLALYRMDYEDLIYGSLWSDATDGIDLSAAKDVELNTDADKTEMNGKMPDAPKGTELLTWLDFNAQNGYFDGTGNTTVDLTDAALGDGALTFAEASGLKNEFTVVFRAKLGYGNNANGALFMLSGNGLASWNNALTVGVPSKSNQVWYRLNQDGSAVTKGGQMGMTGTNIANDDCWHTVAITVNATTVGYYVDGALIGTADGTASKELGSLFTDEATFAARFGKYSDNDATSYTVKGDFDFWQFYKGELTPEQIKVLAGKDAANVTAESPWQAAFAENVLWAVAGAEQMSGYEGIYVNRSLFRLLDNTIRNTGSDRKTHRDIRLMNVAAPGYTVSDMTQQLSTKKYDVLLLLPEVSQVYAENYVHSQELVDAYKASVKALLAKSTASVKILWTPLADDNAVINGYLSDYAEAVCQIAEEDSDILFWDANAFMNQNMQKKASLLHNWFDADMHITPLAALDLARGFFTYCQVKGVSTAHMSELSGHNLRQSSDNRTYKSDVIRDNILANVSVSGTKITVDIAPILAAHPALKDVRLAVVPTVGYGDRNNSVTYLDVSSDNGVSYTFEAPCTDPVIVIYGTEGEKTYRFKDVSVSVKTSAAVGGAEAKPDGVFLDSLQIVGAQEIGFAANTTKYTVDLYQYQRFIQVKAEAHPGLTITVNGVAVTSGARSALIDTNEMDTVTVTVSYGGKSKTYTLKLTRPEYPDIIITEVLQSSTDGRYDLIEIYNASGKELNLLDYSIGYKKDYGYSFANESGDKWPYYFEGNNTGFHSTSGTSATKTGINQITKYSTYGPDKVNAEPEKVAFAADTTMVVWVKYMKDETLSYETLINNLKDLAKTDNYDNKVLNLNGEAVIPSVEQMVVAEVPYENKISGLSVKSEQENFYLEDHGAVDLESGARSWLFILKDSAKAHYHNAITAAGDDIISAAMMSRVSTAANLSTVLYYDVDRGMSAVKDASNLMPAAVTGYTSDKSGYMNLSTFGAIEYWQKPLDLDDDVAPVVVDASEDGKIKLTFRDDTDIRYMELTVDTDGDGIFETVIKQDWVLESSAKSATGTPAAAKERTYTLEVEKGSQYRGFVLDDNNNAASFGCAGDLQITLEGEDTEATVDVQIKLKDSQLLAGLKSDLNIFDAEGKVVGTLSARTLKGTASVKPGQTIKVVGVPEGVEYTVTVIVPDGYEQTAPVTGAVNKGTAAVKLTLIAVPETTVAPTTEPETTVEPTTEPETTVESTTEPEATTEPETTVEPTTEPAATEATEGTTPEATEPAVTEPEVTQPMDTTAPEATVAPTEPETTAPQQTTEPAQGGNSDSENPKTGNELRQQVIVMLIVVVSAAAAAVTVVIGCKYRKLTR